MPTNQAKPGTTKIIEDDVAIVCQCTECKDRAAVTLGAGLKIAIGRLHKAGWRRIDNRVHCPECVADVTNKEGGE